MRGEEDGREGGEERERGRLLHRPRWEQRWRLPERTKAMGALEKVLRQKKASGLHGINHVQVWKVGQSKCVLLKKPKKKPSRRTFGAGKHLCVFNISKGISCSYLKLLIHPPVHPSFHLSTHRLSLILFPQAVENVKAENIPGTSRQFILRQTQRQTAVHTHSHKTHLRTPESCQALVFGPWEAVGEPGENRRRCRGEHLNPTGRGRGIGMEPATIQPRIRWATVTPVMSCLRSAGS